MAPLRVSTTKSEWLPDDPTAFVPTRLWKLPFITTWDDSRNQNHPTDSAEEAKIYQDKFGTKALFPGGDSVLTALWKHYDLCSKVMHGSIYSVSPHIKHEGYEDYYNYFDIEGPQDPNLVTSFFYTVDSHHEIQSIFSSAFKNELRDRQEEWAVLFTSVKAKADFHREKWKHT